MISPSIEKRFKIIKVSIYTKRKNDGFYNSETNLNNNNVLINNYLNIRKPQFQLQKIETVE